MTTQPPSGTEQQIDFKYPWWDGNWLTYEDYKTRVELRADASKEEDLPFLGPRLASNLVGKAFDTLGEISRESLKKADGWSYLLKFLEGKRGRAKVDLLGDMFSEFFLKREAYRKDGEEWNDYEVRFRTLVRRMDRAVKEANTEAKIPSEMYGWFLLNLFMKLSPSDTANIRGKSGSYQMEDVMAAIKVMWSSGGLASRDQEVKVKKNQPGHTYAVDDEEPVEEQQEPNGIYEVDDELEEIQEWHDEAILALAEEPTDGEVLANFREARKALDQARTARSVQGIAHKTVDFVVHRQLAAAQQVKPLLHSQDLMHLLGGRKGFFQHKPPLQCISVGGRPDVCPLPVAPQHRLQKPHHQYLCENCGQHHAVEIHYLLCWRQIV